MKPFVTREICGTEKGYRKHKNSGEHKCQPCKDAHNVYRRATYKPELNKKYVDKYREKNVWPLQEKRRREKEEKKAQKKAEIEARKEARRLSGIAYRADREAKKIAHAKKLADNAKKRKEEREAIERRKIEAENARNAKKEAKLAKIEAENAKKTAKLAEKTQKALEKAKKREILNNQHGIAVGDYDRCKKNNGVACDPCKAIAAKYVRDKFKNDPKYKAKEKEWYKKNPHKRPPKSKGRAIKNGGNHAYYTRQQIFDRDGYDCYLCGDPTDLTAPHVQGQPGWETYPHIEHVIPLAKGGDDTLGNVKIAHAKCNIDKGVKIFEIRTA